MIDLDFSETGSVDEALAEVFSPVEDGDYVLVVTDAQLKPGNSAPGISMRFTLAEDQTKSVFQYFHLDQAGSFWPVTKAQLKQMLDALYDGETPAFSVSEESLKDLLGRQCVATLTIEARRDDPDKLQNTIKVFMPVP